LDDQPKANTDIEDPIGGSAGFSKRAGAATAKAMGGTDPWSNKNKHKELLERPATEFISKDVQDIMMPGGKKKATKLKPLRNSSRGGLSKKLNPA